MHFSVRKKLNIYSLLLRFNTSCQNSFCLIKNDNGNAMSVNLVVCVHHKKNVIVVACSRLDFCCVPASRAVHWWIRIQQRGCMSGSKSVWCWCCCWQCDNRKVLGWFYDDAGMSNQWHSLLCWVSSPSVKAAFALASWDYFFLLKWTWTNAGSRLSDFICWCNQASSSSNFSVKIVLTQNCILSLWQLALVSPILLICINIFLRNQHAKNQHMLDKHLASLLAFAGNFCFQSICIQDAWNSRFQQAIYQVKKHYLGDTTSICDIQWDHEKLVVMQPVSCLELDNRCTWSTKVDVVRTQYWPDRSSDVSWISLTLWVILIWYLLFLIKLTLMFRYI